MQDRNCINAGFMVPCHGSRIVDGLLNSERFAFLINTTVDVSCKYVMFWVADQYI